MPKLIAPLPPGPLALIGDIHGEIDALEAVLARPELAGRHLVFLGDLVDRGPDSPAVVDRVAALVAAGRATCVVGNHELNLLLGRDREGNGWFRDAPDHWQRRTETGAAVRAPFPSRPLETDAARTAMLTFFRSLPLAAARADLRVVHACWDDRSIAQLPASGDVATLMAAHEQRVRDALAARGVLDRAAAQRARWQGLRALDCRPDEMLDDVAIQDMTEQNDNPVAVLTSGREERVAFADRFFVAGKWRFVERSRWWQQHSDPVPVVVGHYWRARVPPPPGARDVFVTPAPTDWAGPERSVFCLDYSVGRRYRERAAGRHDHFETALGAMLWPERRLLFSDRPGTLATC